MANNKPASAYAKPHKMDGSALKQSDIGIPVKMPKRENWTPMNGTVAIGNEETVDNKAIKIRGTGAATKGVMARGPMA
jgi:hypothetical protein